MQILIAKSLMSLVLALSLASYLMATNALAKAQGHEQFEGYSVHFSVFNSSLLNPDIAEQYGFTRGERWGLVNIVIIPDRPADDDGSEFRFGKKVLIDGTFSNMLQQEWPLNFKEIREADAIYYIAPFKFDHRELLHFVVLIKAPEDRYSNTVKFSHSLFHNQPQ